MNVSTLYYEKYAAAFVRGLVLRSDALKALSCLQKELRLLQHDFPRNLLEKSLHDLSQEETEEILLLGKAAGLKLHRFKKTHEILPRVRRILGFLKSVGMTGVNEVAGMAENPDMTGMISLMDVGSGRGAFLWPCLDTFPSLNVLSVDILPHRVDMINAVRWGGVSNLGAVRGDICTLSLVDNSYDVVTLLEVFEHIPDPLKAVKRCVEIAKKYIAVSVPLKADNNPEHKHLLTKDLLTDMFHGAGCTRLHFDGVPGHLMMIAVLKEG